MLTRSLLFVPGHKDKFMESSLNCDADILLPDIEDSVPENKKKVARDNILNYANSEKYDNKIVFPRICDDWDIRFLTVKGITGFMLPKVKSKYDIIRFERLIYDCENFEGFEIGTFKLIPLIENATAILNLKEIIKASNRIIAVAFGSEDYLADIHGTKSIESLLVPRTMVVLAARACGVIPIDTVHVDVFNFQDLVDNLIISRQLGFEGMMALHPDELELIHKYYSPLPEEIEWAKKVIKLKDKGIKLMNGKLIGNPMILRAEQILKTKN